MSIKNYISEKKKRKRRRKLTGIKERSNYSNPPEYSKAEINGDYPSTDAINFNIDGYLPMIDTFFGKDIIDNDEIIRPNTSLEFLPSLVSISLNLYLPVAYYDEFIKMSAYLKDINTNIFKQTKESMNIKLGGTISAFKEFSNNIPIKALCMGRIPSIIFRALENLPTYMISDMFGTVFMESPKPDYVIGQEKEFPMFENFLVLCNDARPIDYPRTSSGITLTRSVFKQQYLTLGLGEDYYSLFMLFKTHGINYIVLDEDNRHLGVSIIAHASYDRWMSLLSWYFNEPTEKPTPKLDSILHYMVKTTSIPVEDLLILYKKPYMMYDQYKNKKNYEFSYDPEIDEDVEDTEERIGDNELEEKNQ